MLGLVLDIMEGFFFFAEDIVKSWISQNSYLYDINLMIWNKMSLNARMGDKYKIKKNLKYACHFTTYKPL